MTVGPPEHCHLVRSIINMKQKQLMTIRRFPVKYPRYVAVVLSEARYKKGWAGSSRLHYKTWTCLCVFNLFDHAFI